ncbi:ATP-binding protein [Cohnella faecalis]|nr:ATP-binding protein [Cohnella faecalis]
MDIEHEEFNLRYAIESVMDIFTPRLAKISIDLIYELDPSVPQHIIGDSLRLKQILINLIGNAIKFTSKGEIFVKISVDEHIKNDYKIRFDIRDTESGYQKTNFHSCSSLSQVDSSTSRKYGEQGWACHLHPIVELMNGGFQ